MRYINNDLSGKRILITGGGGFIGSNLAFYFQNQHPLTNVTVFDCFRSDEKFPSGNFKALGDKRNLIGFEGEIIQGNINHSTDLKKIEEGKFDIIFHEAAISDTTVEDEILMMQTNVKSFENILQIAAKNGSKVIYASSAGTYGNSAPPNTVGVKEEPTNLYGKSKLKMDDVTYGYLKTEPNMHIVGLRYFNVYGGREFLKGTTASMILQLGLQALKYKKVRLFKFGEHQRDFIYIDDVVQANVKAIEAKKPGVYNVGTGISRTFNDIVSNLKQHLGNFEVEYFDNPYGFYQNHTEAAIESTKLSLEYAPQFTLEAGIQAYVNEINSIHQNKLYQ